MYVVHRVHVRDVHFIYACLKAVSHFMVVAFFIVAAHLQAILSLSLSTRSPWQQHQAFKYSNSSMSLRCVNHTPHTYVPLVAVFTPWKIILHVSWRPLKCFPELVVFQTLWSSHMQSEKWKWPPACIEISSQILVAAAMTSSSFFLCFILGIIAASEIWLSQCRLCFWYGWENMQTTMDEMGKRSRDLGYIWQTIL